MSASQARIAEIYRAIVGQGKRNSVARQEAIEEAAQVVEREIAEGTIVLNQRSAIHAELKRIDEADGNRADAIIATAAKGGVTLEGLDLDVVVTLGGGLRKLWKHVQADDLQGMLERRQLHVSQASDALTTLTEQVEVLLPTVTAYGTFGAAYKAGGFPPASAVAS